MTDRELLEAAARAAGINIVGWGELGTPRAIHADDIVNWNPLANDGDALRLAVKLRIVVTFGGVSDSVQAWVTVDWPSPVYPGRKSARPWLTLEYVPDAMWTSGYERDVKFANYKMEEPGMVRGLEAAVRRAIVRAAAALAPPVTLPHREGAE